jgi:methylenetetrahydrofolate reductase (NADPH)
VAIASAIKQRYHVPVVPHIICSGYNRQDTENELIDYSFLDIKDLLVLRGDKAKQDARFVPKTGGLSHATELIEQVEQFNKGLLEYGDRHEFCVNRPFTYGVAAYPEKHEEAMNLQQDIERLREKQDLGAGYAVTQMFFDTDAYLRFVDKCRTSGITMPIVPGLKPLGTLNHCTMLPRVFHVDFPVELAEKLSGVKSDDDVKKVGIEWCIAQCERLRKEGAPCIHFYTMNAAGSIEQIAKEVWK